MSKPREPIDLIVAKGKKNLTKAEIEERRIQEVKVPSDNIEIPLYISKYDELKNEFNRLATMLLDSNMITNLDSASLARFIVSEHEYQRVTNKMLDIQTINNVYKNYADLQDKFFKQARAAASDLGLTISSRCKLVVPKKEDGEKEQSKEEKLFGAKL